MPADSAFVIAVHRELPAGWPSAAATGEAQCYVFQTREFVQSWLAAFGADRNLTALFVEVRDRNNVLLMLLPLCLERRGGLTTLSFLDQGVADYNAAIMFPAAAAYPALNTSAFWDELFAALPPFDIATFDKLPEMVGSLRNPAFGLANTSSDAAAHGSTIAGDWPAVEAANFQSPKEMRKKLRQLDRVGAVELVVADTPELRESLLERLVAQKQRRYEETRVAGFAEHPEQLEFLRQATGIFAASGQLMLCGLSIAGEIAAIQWSLTLNGRLYALVTGYEAGEIAKYSPGRVLNYLLLRWLFDHGFSYFDMGVGDEAYKLDNADTTVPLARAVILRTARGRVIETGRNVVSRLKATPAGERVRQLRWTLARALRKSRTG